VLASRFPLSAFILYGKLGFGVGDGVLAGMAALTRPSRTVLALKDWSDLEEEEHFCC